jgi:hypothetical protein
MNKQTQEQQPVVEDGMVLINYEREALLRSLHGLDLLTSAAAVEMANFRNEDMNSIAFLYQFKAELYEQLVLKKL